MKISIDFDTKNIATLIKSVHFAAWVKNSTKLEADHDKAMEDFVQYIYSSLYNAGEKKLIKFDAKNNEYYTADDIDEAHHKEIEEYDNDMFWEELASRLATRDVEKRRGKAATKEDPKLEEARISSITKEEELYFIEFEKHGLDRLKITQ